MNSFLPAAVRPAPAAPPARQLDAASACPTVPEIAAAIDQMDSHAAGVDGLPTCLFRDASQPALPPEATTSNARAHIAAALHAVFERTSATGTIPEGWRRAVLVPIYKKGDKADISNYLDPGSGQHRRGRRRWPPGADLSFLPF
jgi:hypothetical protein